MFRTKDGRDPPPAAAATTSDSFRFLIVPKSTIRFEIGQPPFSLFTFNRLGDSTTKVATLTLMKSTECNLFSGNGKTLCGINQCDTEASVLTFTLTGVKVSRPIERLILFFNCTSIMAHTV